jgi:hypothetical protein
MCPVEVCANIKSKTVKTRVHNFWEIFEPHHFVDSRAFAQMKEMQLIIFICN